MLSVFYYWLLASLVPFFFFAFGLLYRRDGMLLVNSRARWVVSACGNLLFFAAASKCYRARCREDVLSPGGFSLRAEDTLLSLSLSVHSL